MFMRCPFKQLKSMRVSCRLAACIPETRARTARVFAGHRQSALPKNTLGGERKGVKNRF